MLAETGNRLQRSAGRSITADRGIALCIYQNQRGDDAGFGEKGKDGRSATGLPPTGTEQ